MNYFKLKILSLKIVMNSCVYRYTQRLNECSLLFEKWDSPWSQVISFQYPLLSWGPVSWVGLESGQRCPLGGAQTHAPCARSPLARLHLRSAAACFRWAARGDCPGDEGPLSWWPWQERTGVGGWRWTWFQHGGDPPGSGNRGLSWGWVNKARVFSDPLFSDWGPPGHCGITESCSYTVSVAVLCTYEKLRFLSSNESASPGAVQAVRLRPEPRAGTRGPR